MGAWTAGKQMCIRDRDCQFHRGLHIHEDHFRPEIVDQKTLKPLRDGMEGELVISTLTKEDVYKRQPLHRIRRLCPAHTRIHRRHGRPGIRPIHEIPFRHLRTRRPPGRDKPCPGHFPKIKHPAPFPGRNPHPPTLIHEICIKTADKPPKR